MLDEQEVEIDSEWVNRRGRVKPDTDSRCAIRKAISLIIIGLCVLGAGCQGVPTIWEAEVRSPDGLWIASARTIQNGGFGSASIDTIVYLKWTKDSKPPQEVLRFACHGPAPRPYVLDNNATAGGTIGLAMKWVTPSHLEVTYDKHPDLYFQVVKIAGIDISVQDLSEGSSR
jgi:hypothetical protein